MQRKRQDELHDRSLQLLSFKRLLKEIKIEFTQNMLSYSNSENFRVKQIKEDPFGIQNVGLLNGIHGTLITLLQFLKLQKTKKFQFFFQSKKLRVKFLLAAARVFWHSFHPEHSPNPHLWEQRALLGQGVAEKSRVKGCWTLTFHNGPISLGD